jgi:hypothetical protein
VCAATSYSVSSTAVDPQRPKTMRYSALAGLVLALVLAARAFAATAAEPPAPAAPCDTPEHRRFDFWVGEWTVTAPQLPTPARSSISLVQEGCALREEYDSRRGVTGTSLSFYEAARSQWHQTWIDNQGQPLYLRGGWRDGRMVLEDEAGNRVTWEALEGGRVRQLWEQEKGDETVVVFDGVYEPRRTDGAGGALPGRGSGSPPGG